MARSSMLVLASALLTACGGGGGGGGPVVTPPPPAPTPPPTTAPSTPTPTAPTQTPTETPAPTPTFPEVGVAPTFNTQEFRESGGPGQHNAHAAWIGGNTGEDVTIAVIDTGIDVDSPEFAGRLSPDSTDIHGSRGQLNASDDHGTNVAMVAAAARDNTGILGIAWDATVLAIRADTPGTCGADAPGNPNTDCEFADVDIANSIDYAVANGAQVINISLGGEGGATPVLQTAINNATSAGVLIVLAAGNENQRQLTQFALDALANGNGAVLIVGSVDENYDFSDDFSNRAGTNPEFFITARGERICCTYEDGELFVDDEGFIYLFSGTSFAAPQVAGAAALLAQAFPTLTGAEIAEILLRTAFDAGTAGPDRLYGRGILDINAAFQPLGPTSLAGTTQTLSLGEMTGTASPAMGDALMTTAALTGVITDEFGRAFEASLGTGIRSAQQANPLHGALAGQQRHLSGGNQRTSVAFSIDGRGNVAQLNLHRGEAEQARVLAAQVVSRLSPETQFGFAYAQGAEGLVARMQGQDRPAFMIAGNSTGDLGLFRGSDASVAFRQQLGRWGLTASASHGQTWAGAVERHIAALRGQRAQDDLSTMSLSLDRRFGALDAALGLTWLGEDTTMLGAHFQEGFGLAGADSLFVDASAGWSFAPDWRLGASLRQGWTRARRTGIVAQDSSLSSRAFAFDVERRNLFTGGDALAFRVSQPLRVEGGQLGLLLPSSWDYETLSADYTLHRIALSPEGRQLDAEVAWRSPLWGGDASASLFWRKEPGHVETAPDDAGVAFRWGRKF
ncbi:S8 family peptidase [Alteraurantiacibacter aquimixticola]|uniref:S8 family peptidase n=1 Tax=Alteraurantiacibacter aquimixticola TaxID=2489173 RepID=UPI00145A076C|nr:S8 family peptidase [Alteraurantiacibacter aquimixticola]